MILECFSMLFYFLSTLRILYATARYHFILLLDRAYFKVVIDQTGSAIALH